MRFLYLPTNSLLARVVKRALLYTLLSEQLRLRIQPETEPIRKNYFTRRLKPANISSKPYHCRMLPLHVVFKGRQLTCQLCFCTLLENFQSFVVFQTLRSLLLYRRDFLITRAADHSPNGLSVILTHQNLEAVILPQPNAIDHIGVIKTFTSLPLKNFLLETFLRCDSNR